IPSYINELRNGIREMESQGYYLEHLEISKQLDAMETELAAVKEQVSQLIVDEPKEAVEAMKEKVESFYELLENEVESRHYVEQHKNQTAALLEQVTLETREVSDECAVVQQSYKIQDQDAKIPKTCLEALENIQKRFDLLQSRTEEQQSAYSSLQQELSDIRTQLDSINTEQENFSESLKALRTDEHEARARLDLLKKKLQETDRMLHKANTPGIPEEIDIRLEEAEENLYVAMQGLQEVPLNMKLVDNYLVKAERSIEEVEGKAVEMVENVQLIERIIQYGNRYRKTNPQMNHKLLEAEESFRQLRYSKALEEAATAVENFEPGSMKRIEVLSKENAWRV